jgi:acyl-CoA thioester hydrolase
VRTQIIGHDSKRLHLYHSLHKVGEDQELAGNEQMLLHVDLAGPRSAPFSTDTLSRLQSIVTEQKDLPAPAHIGRVIALPPAR